IATLREVMSDKTGDIRTIRHDLNNVLNAVTGLTLLNEKISEINKNIAAHGAKIEALEGWRDKAEGAAGAVKVMANIFWALFGGAIMTSVYFLAKLFFTVGG